MARKKLFSLLGARSRRRDEWEYDEYDEEYDDEDEYDEDEYDDDDYRDEDEEDWEEQYDRLHRDDRRRWLRWAVPAMAVLVVLIVALGVTMICAARVTKSDTIYPNISINGVAVGDLTVEQAESKIRAFGEDPYIGTKVKVLFPLDNTLTFTAEELGISKDARLPAETAYAYGRNGSSFHNLRMYLACKRNPVEIAWDVETLLDEELLEKRVSAMATQVNQKLLNAEPEIREDGVVIIKGMTTVMVDPIAVCEQVKQAFVDQNFADIQCQLKEVENKTSVTAAGTKKPEDAEDAEDAEKAESDKNDANAVSAEDAKYAALQMVYDAIYVEPVNAMYDKETGGATESKQGVSFDMEAAKRKWDRAELGDEIFLPFVFTDPEIDEQTLIDRLFADRLAKKSTTLSGSSSDRITNITLAAKAMNGTIINPGETFDYNSCLGQRTTAKGYREAGAYENGQHVTSVGGGICQPSSTLYYCTLYANLQITVRECHYFVVNYLPLGMDATVSWGGPDFRFVNSRNYPIEIKAWVSDGYLTVELWGTDEDGSYVEITSDTWQDDDFYYAQTYRNVYDADGNRISSTKEAYSRYHKYEAGEESPSPSPSPTPSAPPSPEASPTETPATPTPTPTAPADPTPVETTPPPPETNPPETNPPETEQPQITDNPGGSEDE